MPIGDGLPDVGLVPKTCTVIFVALEGVTKSSLKPVKVVAAGAVTGMTVRKVLEVMP